MTTRQYDANEDRNLLGEGNSYFSSLVRSSRSRSRSGSPERNSSVSVDSTDRNTHQPVGTDDHDREHFEKSLAQTVAWIPYTFRHWFMGSLSLIALSLCLVVFLLWWRSSTSYGLGPDNDSNALLFGWRYSPTLITVIYIQFTAMLFNDVKRTEPFARLARPEGAKASSSILYSSGPWWVALYDGFARKKNGGRSWVLICASLVNIIGFLAISPLSSAFLYSEEVVVPRSTDFLRLSPQSGSPLPIAADRTTHFRTIANLLQNVSTSGWITDNYTILPFWPSSLKDTPLNTLPTSSSETWEGETTMFKSELSCERMAVEAQTNGSYSYQKDYGESPGISVVWSTPDGCKYGVEVSIGLISLGGGSWSNTSNFFYGYDSLYKGTVSAKANSTAECNNREVIVVTEPWNSTIKPGAYSAHLCDTKYFMANITASVGLSGDEPEISFNESEYDRNKVLIPDTLVNTTQFRDLTLDADWATYMISIIWSSTAMLGGAAVILGALYDYNMTRMARDPDLVASAAKAKQRYFGEVLQASLNQQGASHQVPMQGQIHAVQTQVVVQSGPAIALGILFAISFLLLLAVWWMSQLRHRPLNLSKDPATTVGVAYLIAHNLRTKCGFQALRQPSSKELQKKLGREWYYTDSQGLGKNQPGETASQDFAQSENGTPTILRLPALLTLLVLLILVVVGVVVLYHYAESYRLYGKAFVYEVKLSFLSSGLSGVAPFSIIPTVIATLLGLWWSAMDDNFRRLQPYLSMSKSSSPYKKSVDLSYQSSYWMWAATKAVFNKHWLLFLVTLGSTLSPVFVLQDTTAMAALFDLGTGNVIQPVTLHRQLEVRDIPFVFETEQSTYPDNLSDYSADILTDLYKNISSYWMYTATIQLALNGSEPAWSKDGWSFVPLDLRNITAAKSLSAIGASAADNVNSISQTNITFETPAIRGRIECSEPPLQVLMNISNFYTSTDLRNGTIYNMSTVPDGLLGGYQLGNVYISEDLPSSITPILPSQNWTECPGCTTAFANPSQIICCGNGSSDSHEGGAAVGYWSPNADGIYYSPRWFQKNFTAKWFYGDAVAGIKTADTTAAEEIADPGLLFPNPPSMSLLNCEPIVETANSKITVDPSSGEIQDFDIFGTPQTVSEPWSDDFLSHSGSITDDRSGYTTYNVTLSYGRLFMTTMLTAADTLHIGGATHTLGFTTEDLSDNTYNIRDEMNGLNMDFMTYATYTMANKDPKALLDQDTFRRLTQKTFTTFFQHFVSSNISMQTGGWAYQKINASLPSDLGQAVELVNHYLPGNTPSAYQDDMHPISHTNRTVAATVSQRVELLQMNAVAVWLSIGIMAWLILTTVVVAVFQKRYFGSLVRNVECLGDVLVLIAGSANFLEVVREVQAGRLSASDYEQLRTRLGWFVDEDGGLRWGIEMEESFRDGPGVHWVSAPYFSKEKGSYTWNSSDEGREV
ncbi:uncharacterized protein N7459_008685 [Penicillium hispanicum]|uniref:uncharacterized protein n=1 Tax=Penicillium hispanicum TaxID=1080232 RepID=UPI002542099D|nr:uncharacterized protein N7459_008685 [Penicillium hispanicum]KAJ5574258.1 hypothetical protein N7459_008685 [Penicillium hispanicum]